MVVRQEGSQAERVLCAVHPGADDHRAFQPHPGGFQDRRPTPVSRAEEDEGVPMVALECQQPLTGTLSPPADTPSMSRLPHQTPVQDNASPSPQPLLRLPSSPSSSRPGCKRKRPREDEEDPCIGGCAVDSPDRCQPCWGRCLEECERKRRRLSSSHGSSETESSNAEDGVDTFEQYLTAESHPSHMDVNVEQTLDVITTSGGGVVEQSVDSVSASEMETAPLDIGVDPPLTPFIVELFPDPVSQQIPDSVAEVDVVGDPVDPPSDPSPAASSHLQHPDSCGGGGDTSSGDDDAFVEACESRPQRISPFLNTPKQRKEERRKILKLSIQKMRDVDDPEHFLRRSVLINNTMKRLQRELREEKMRNSPRRSCYGLYRRPPSPFHYDPLNHNSYLMSDESFGVGDNDRITDDMTDALVTRLEATSSHLVVVPTPSPSPSPLDEPQPCLAGFPPVSSSDDVTTTTTAATCPTSLSCLSDVTSSVTESMSVMNSEITSSFFAEEPCSSLTDDLMAPVPESTASLEAVSMTSSVTDLTSSVTDMTSFVSDLTSPSCVSSSSSSSSSPPSPPSPVSVACNGAYDSSFTEMVRESQSPSSSCSSESQREKQLYTDIDVVFNNLIHALGDS